MNIKKILFFALLIGQVSCNSAQRSLTILHTNDTHSQIETCDDRGEKNVAGVQRRYEFIKQKRAENECLLVLDAGDFCQGSAYFNLFKGRVEVELMNLMGYDAATIGNHEFDNGLDSMAARFNEANFPIVCANYRFKNKALAKVVKPYTVIEKCGHRIGIFGLTTDVIGLVSASVTDGATYLDPIESAKYAIGKLKEEKCDAIICLSHLGFDTDKPTSDAMCDTILAKHFTKDDITLIVGGHTHTRLESPVYVNGIPIVQTGRKGVFVGEATIDF